MNHNKRIEREYKQNRYVGFGRKGLESLEERSTEKAIPSNPVRTIENLQSISGKGGIRLI